MTEMSIHENCELAAPEEIFTLRLSCEINFISDEA